MARLSWPNFTVVVVMGQGPVLFAPGTSNGFERSGKGHPIWLVPVGGLKLDKKKRVGVNPELGRTLAAALDAAPGSSPVAVMGFAQAGLRFQWTDCPVRHSPDLSSACEYEPVSGQIRVRILPRHLNIISRTASPDSQWPQPTPACITNRPSASSRPKLTPVPIFR